MASISATTHSFKKPDIILNSPVGSKPATYKWPLTYCSKGQKIDGADEIIETIRWVAIEYSEFKPAIEAMLAQQDLKSYDGIKALCDKYNKVAGTVVHMNKGTSLNKTSRASPALLKHIIQQVYNYSVDEPAELNKYSPFSSETYGETSFEFMAQLIERNQFKPGEQDIFIDLGSGVGHLVLQLAATLKCKKCYGIEIADRPAGYAKKMVERFKFWMNWHGKIYTDFEIFHGDFFDKQYTEIIRSATYIFVNNFAFKPDDDHKLKQKFLDLKDGTQILSSKPFCSPKSRVSERHLSDLGSIMQVIEIQPDLKKDTVSWTPKPLPYYLHVLDSSRLQKYYERQKRRSGKSSEKGKPSKRRKVTNGGSESCSEDSEDQTVYGPTTRKAWSEWCNSSINVSNRTSTDSGKTIVSSRNSSTDIESNVEVPGEQDEDDKPDSTTVYANNHNNNNNNNNNIIISSISNYKQTKDSDSGATPSKQRNEKLKNEITQQYVDAKKQEETTSNQDTIAQSKSGQSNNGNQTPRSCLDKKRDYAIKKNNGSSSYLQNVPAAALYSISKPADSNGSSPTKIPNIVIKVKATIDSKMEKPNSRPDANQQTIDNKKSPEPTAKKLRQRKKSTLSDDTSGSINGTTTSTNNNKTNATTTPKNENKVADTIPAKKGSATSRSKKVAGGTSSTTGVNRGALKSNLSSNKKSSHSSPEKNMSLELLHAKTVESVSTNVGHLNQPAPGCENYSLKSITETPSLPTVVIKDVNMWIDSVKSSKRVDQYLESCKMEVEKFLTKVQQPNYRETLYRLIEQERARKRELSMQLETLAKENKLLAEREFRAMKVHCDIFGITNTRKAIFQNVIAEMRKHQDLLGHKIQLEASYHAATNQGRTMNPPPAHSNNTGLPNYSMVYRDPNPANTLDLSLKQSA